MLSRNCESILNLIYRTSDRSCLLFTYSCRRGEEWSQWVCVSAVQTWDTVYVAAARGSQRFIRPWRTWPAISENTCKSCVSKKPHERRDERVSGSSAVVKAVLLTSLQEAPERQWHECDWMSHYDVWCGKSPRPYFIYKYQDKSLTCPIWAIGDNTGGCVW